MVCGYIRSAYTAPCRWYPGGPVGRIRWYFTKPTAQNLPVPTVFWPYSMELDHENRDGVGEITGKGLRVYDRGVNVNELPGDHYEGTPDDFAGNGIDPHA
jgi:hypothetical protein